MDKSISIEQSSMGTDTGTSNTSLDGHTSELEETSNITLFLGFFSFGPDWCKWKLEEPASESSETSVIFGRSSLSLNQGSFLHKI